MMLQRLKVIDIVGHVHTSAVCCCKERTHLCGRPYVAVIRNKNVVEIVILKWFLIQFSNSEVKKRE